MTRVVSAAMETVRDFRVTVLAGDVSRFSRDFLEDERRSLGAVVYAREYECAFEDSGGGVFRREIVEAALTDEVKPLWTLRVVARVQAIQASSNAKWGANP